MPPLAIAVVPWALLCAAAAPVGPSRLTRVEALRLGAARNLDLLVQRLEVERAAAGAGEAWGEFAPVLSFAGAYGDAPPLDLGPNPGEHGLDRSRDLGLDAEVAWDTPLGSSLRLGARNDQFFLGPETPGHRAELYVTAAQRLLRGGWPAGARSALSQAELLAEEQRELFRDELDALLVDIDDAYWQLAFRQADLEIKTRSLERAESQHSDTQENISRGLVAPGEIYLVEENVVFFTVQRVSAQEQLQLAQRRLALLLHLEPDAPLVAADALEAPAPPPDGPDVAPQAVRLGLSDNGQLAAERLALSRARVRLAFSENRLLPVLDLQATLALNGFDRDLGKSWEEAVRFDRPEVRVGLALSVPLDYRPAFSEARRAEVEVEQQLVGLAEAEQRVRFAIENALTQIRKQSERVGLAERLIKLAELKLSTEEEKYQNGVTTLTDVVRFQRDLDESWIGFRRAQAELLTQRARLLRAQGRLHREVGIDVDAPAGAAPVAAP